MKASLKCLLALSRDFAFRNLLHFLYEINRTITKSQDMSTLSSYLQTWRLKLSHTKTVTAAFHLNNREAKRELKIYNSDRLLPFCPTPTYLGVKPDKSLTFRHYIVTLCKKTILARHTAEATRGLGMGCWC